MMNAQQYQRLSSAQYAFANATPPLLGLKASLR
jgi:hypothetical protein